MAFLRHERDANARRTIRPAFVAAPVALLVTVAAVTLGIASQGPSSSSAPQAARPAAAAIAAAPRPAQPARPARRAADAIDRPETVSRSAARDLAPLVLPAKKPNLTSEVETRRAVRKADTELWTTETLNLWTRPGENADQVGQLEAAKKVVVTGRELWGRVEVVVGGKSRWVTSGYLSPDEPVAPLAPVGAAAGLSMAPCPDGSVEDGLSDSAIYVYRSVCRAFPQIYDVGGYANRGEHASGKAMDLMISDVSAGLALADFLRANAAELNLYDVIYRQRIFTQERSGEGWRFMEDRGSPTANHMDHIHVQAY